MMGHYPCVLGGTAALHSHSTVGGCIFLPWTFFPAGHSVYGSGFRQALRNSGLCQPQTRHRQGRMHFPNRSASHTKIHIPPVSTVSSRCRRFAIRACSNTDSCLQWGQCAVNPVRSDPSPAFFPFSSSVAIIPRAGMVTASPAPVNAPNGAPSHRSFLLGLRPEALPRQSHAPRTGSGADRPVTLPTRNRNHAGWALIASRSIAPARGWVTAHRASPLIQSRRR